MPMYCLALDGSRLYVYVEISGDDIIFMNTSLSVPPMIYPQPLLIKLLLIR